MYEYQLLQQFEEKYSSTLNDDLDEKLILLKEVKIGSKIIDVVLSDINLTNIIAIELKVKKWKKALRQAISHQLWASKTYIALPRKHMNGAIKNKSLFEKLGIGLISIDGTVKIEIEAKESEYKIQSYVNIAQNEIIKQMKRCEKN